MNNFLNLPKIFLTISIVVLSAFTGCQSNSLKTTTKLIELDVVSNMPTLFAEGIISTHLNERDIAISSDGNELVYTLGTHDNSNRGLIMLQQIDGQWSEAALLPFSGEFQDIEPFFSPDGKRLYFASTRPLKGESEAGDYNIWYAEKVNGEWTNVFALDSTINSETDEYYPSLSVNGNLYFTASYEDAVGREDIYMSAWTDGRFQHPKPLSEHINTPAYEFNAFIAPSEDLLIFSSFGREDNLGGGDLYYSKKDETGNWLPSKNLGAQINSSKLDYCPFIDYSNDLFYFTSNRKIDLNTPSSFNEIVDSYTQTQNGLGNIFRIDLNAIEF